MDPLKDVEAARAEIELGINSRQNISRERGKDFEKTTAENVADVAMLEAAGLPTTTSPAPVAPVPAPPAEV